MTKGQIADAERYALNEFDRWNEVSGAVPVSSGTYYELQAVIEDAVHIGIQMALEGKVEKDLEGNVIKKK